MLKTAEKVAIVQAWSEEPLEVATQVVEMISKTGLDFKNAAEFINYLKEQTLAENKKTKPKEVVMKKKAPPVVKQKEVFMKKAPPVAVAKTTFLTIKDKIDVVNELYATDNVLDYVKENLTKEGLKGEPGCRYEFRTKEFLITYLRWLELPRKGRKSFEEYLKVKGIPDEGEEVEMVKVKNQIKETDEKLTPEDIEKLYAEAKETYDMVLPDSVNRKMKTMVIGYWSKQVKTGGVQIGNKRLAPMHAGGGLVRLLIAGWTPKAVADWILRKQKKSLDKGTVFTMNGADIKRDYTPFYEQYYKMTNNQQREALQELAGVGKAPKDMWWNITLNIPVELFMANKYDGYEKEKPDPTILRKVKAGKAKAKQERIEKELAWAAGQPPNDYRKVNKATKAKPKVKARKK